eukprot:scaffold9232_cov110-Cylindrotheca_fusiformis.AAC.4
MGESGKARGSRSSGNVPGGVEPDAADDGRCAGFPHLYEHGIGEGSTVVGLVVLGVVVKVVECSSHQVTRAVVSGSAFNVVGQTVWGAGGIPRDLNWRCSSREVGLEGTRLDVLFPETLKATVVRGVADSGVIRAIGGRRCGTAGCETGRHGARGTAVEGRWLCDSRLHARGQGAGTRHLEL